MDEQNDLINIIAMNLAAYRVINLTTEIDWRDFAIVAINTYQSLKINQMDEWRSMDTAPMDGTRVILGFSRHKYVSESYYDANWKCWRDDIGFNIAKFSSYEDDNFEEPTHWMPLPKLPNY